MTRAESWLPSDSPTAMPPLVLGGAESVAALTDALERGAAAGIPFDTIWPEWARRYAALFAPSWRATEVLEADVDGWRSAYESTMPERTISRAHG